MDVSSASLTSAGDSERLVSALRLPIASIGELPSHQQVGLVDHTATACLRARLEREGLLTPIWVRRNGNAAKDRWSVVCGRHRLLAAKELGWTEIAAEERAGPDSGTDELRRLQLAENLDRRTPRPIEQSRFVMDRWREAAADIVGAPISWETVSQVPSGTTRPIDEAAAKACGKSDRWVRDYRKVFAAIVAGLPEHFAALNATELGASFEAMKYVASLPEIKRRAAAAAIIAAPEATNLKAVLVNAGIEDSTGNRVDPSQPDATFLGAYGKMKGPRRRATLIALAEELIPSDVLDMADVFRRRGLLG